MKTIVLVVHGVGFFNEKEVVEETRRRFEKTSISPATILPFNWDSRTTTFFDRVSIGRDADLTFLAEVGEGILRATHAGFLSKTAKYGGLPKHLLRFQNALSLVLQILCLAAAALLCLNFSLLWLPMAWLGRFLLVVVILALLITATGIASGSFLGVCVSARRVLLSLAWPVVYCFAVCVATPFYLLITSFIASALVLAYLGKHWGVIIFSQQTNAFSDGLVYLVGSAVLFSLVVTAGIVLQRITQPFFKAVADVVRYIGVESYRNRIQHEVKELIEAIPEHPATN